MSPKKIFIVSLLVTIVVGFFCISNLVLADEFGLETTASVAGLTSGPKDLPTLAGNILGTALSFIGVLFFALMVFGGFMWMTARGNEEQTKKALNTITAAVIGLIIVLSSYTITSFVFKSVGIQSTPSGTVTGKTQSTTGTDTWCGRTDVELLSTFEIPSGWTSYKCMDVVVSADEEASYCKDGKLYASADVNKCPGSQKCCDSTKVPEGYGKFCLVKAEVDQTPTCEKIGLDFNQEKVCVGKYDTETACKTAIKDGVGTSKKEGEECTETIQCNEGLTCRYVVEGEGRQSDKKECQSKLKSGEGPCVDVVNDCEIGTDPYQCRTADVASITYKICSVPKVDGGRCLDASDCAQGWECKDRVCTAMKCKIGDSSTCPVDQYCSNGNVTSQAIYKPACYSGKVNDPCEEHGNCQNGWCKKAIAGQQDKCQAKLSVGASCDKSAYGDAQCNGICASTGKCVD